MATFMERLSFLQKVPTLMKATADDENPCPGYLFQEIGKISHESSGCGQCLLEYLLERLQVESCHVKLKVLKIFVHLCGHGSNHFLTELRRNSTFIQQASVYSGPPDPVHGTALYQKVRNTAQEVARLLFTDAFSTKNSVCVLSTAPATMGMGSATTHRSGMQGFGYCPGKQVTGADSILDKIQKAAEVVASAVLPPTEQQGIRLHDNHYRAVVAPSAPIEVAVPACAYNLPASRPKVTKRSPGQVGGGWEETDSGNSSSHNSSQDIGTNSRASVSAGTGSQSGASRESSGDLSERVEALQLGDCGQETALINRLTEGSRVFLSREESQLFIKECCILNCEVVVELLSVKLQDPSQTVKMRALCAVSCLMTTDLLSVEQMFGATQGRLRLLSDGPPGPVANKATKILRQLEALTGGSQPAAQRDMASSGRQAAASEVQDSLILDRPLDGHVKLVQPDVSPTGPSRPLDRPSSPSGSTPPHIENSGGDNQVAADDTQPVTHGSPRRHSSLSLFAGMELVTAARPLCQQTPREKSAREESPSVCNNSSQTVSAFSFLYF